MAYSYNGYSVTLSITDADNSTFTVPTGEVIECMVTCGTGSNKSLFGYSICANGEIIILNPDGKYNSKKFDGAKIVVKCTANDNSMDITRNTVYVVSFRKSAGNIIMQVVDSIGLADVDYLPTVTFPCTMQELANDVCKTFTSNYSITGMINGSVTVKKKPSGSCRKILEAIAMCEGANVCASPTGQIQLKRYSTSSTQTDLSSIITVNPEAVGDSFSITGVSTTVYASVKEEGKDTYRTVQKTYTAGDGSTLIRNGIINDDNAQTIVNAVYNNVKGITFTPVIVSIFDSPHLELFSRIKFNDVYLGNVSSYITDLSWSYGGTTMIGIDGESEVTNDGDYLEDQIDDINDYLDADSETSEKNDKEIMGSIGDLEEQQSDFLEQFETYKKEMEDKLTQSTTAYYETIQTTSDGAQIKYVHDNKELSKSSQVWKYTADSIALSIDGGKTYPYGITVDGQLIMSKITADDITALGITAKDIYVGTNKQTYIAEDGSFQFGGTNGIRYQKSNGKIYLGSNTSITWDSLPNDVVSGDYLDDTIGDAVGGKADKTYVDSELSKKANSSDLNSKADKTDLVNPNLVPTTDLFSWNKETNCKLEYDPVTSSFKMTTTATRAGVRISVPVQSSTQYTISFYVTGNCGFYKTTTSTATNLTSAGSMKSLTGIYTETVTTTSTAKFLNLYLYATSGTTCLVRDVKVEKGATATAFQPVGDNHELATTITKNTVDTTYVNALGITSKYVSTDWVYAGGINANQITSGKVTANQMSVSELNALKATLGGFLIRNKYIETTKYASPDGVYTGWDDGYDATAPTSYGLQICARIGTPTVDGGSDVLGNKFLQIRWKAGPSSSMERVFYVDYAGNVKAYSLNVTGDAGITVSYINKREANVIQQYNGVQIESGTDLNEILYPYIGYSPSNDVSSTLLHCPYTSRGFRLECAQTGTGTVMQQTLYPNDGQIFYRRVYRNSAWNAWYKYTGTQV